MNPELAITLDFNVKNGSVIKKTSVISKEPSVERNFELRRSAKFSSTCSEAVKKKEDTIADDDKLLLQRRQAELRKEISQGLEKVANLAAEQHMKDKHFAAAADPVTDAEKLHTLRYSSGVLPVKDKPKIINPAQTHPVVDLPYIDEDENELNEAIRDATGLGEDEVVASIQLTSTNESSPASTLLVSTQRSYSGTDTIHMSEKVIKRDYRDL